MKAKHLISIIQFHDPIDVISYLVAFYGYTVIFQRVNKTTDKYWKHKYPYCDFYIIFADILQIKNRQKLRVLMIFDLELEKSFAEKSNSIAFKKIRKHMLKEKKDRRAIPQQNC